MKTSLLVLLGIFLCFGRVSFIWAAQAKPQKSCIGSDPEQQKIFNQFSWRNNDPKFKPDFCDPKNLAYRVAKAILFLKSELNMDHFSTDKFDKGVISSDPFHFFSSRIQTLEFEPKSQVDCSTTGVQAYVSATGARDGIMHICPYLSTADDLWISSALIHESRHQDGYPHVLCKHAPYLGADIGTCGACDKSYSSGGSYAVQTEYLVKVSRSDRVDPSIRQNARAQAIENFVDRFNSLPLGIQKGAVLVSDDLKVHFYDGKTTAPLHPLANSEIVLYQYSGMLNVYDPAKSSLAVFADGEHAAPSVIVNSGSNRMVDEYENARTICTLYTNSVACDFSGKKVSLPIKDFTPIGFGTYAPLDPSDPTIYIISKDRHAYRISSASKLVLDSPSYYINVGDWDAKFQIALGFDGKVYEASKDPNSTTRIVRAPGLNPDENFTKMITPYYWSKELQKL